MRATNPEIGLSGNGSITYSYDDSGNLATRTDPRVTTTFSAYDGMNRVTGKSYNDGTTPAVGYAYYPSSSTAGCPKLSQGRLMSVTAGTLVNNYLCYDIMGRVTSSSQATGGVTYNPFSYVYDKSGALASVTYPSGRVVTNTFDAAGRINQVTGPSNKNYASQVAYAPQGAIQSLRLYNGVVETWAFNATRQQPTSLQASLGATALLNLTWGYGADSTNNGNVQSQTIARSAGLPATVSQTYQYTDPSNRLSYAIEPNLPNYGGWYQAYNYDAFGNRAIPPGYDVPNPDQTPAALTEFTLNRWKRGSGDTYDGSGNQTGLATRSNPGATVNVFTYDGENRMVTSNIANMGTVTYSYDGEGRRVQKSYTCSTGTCTTVFVYDAMGQLAAEYSTAPNTVSGTQYLTADSLGSTRMVTDGSGNVTQCYDYLPFGEEIRQGFNGRGSCYPPTGVYPHPADATSRKFTGKERDVETGLDYFGARYFSAAQGRWISPDWSATPQAVPYADFSDPQTLNLYGYARNNPLAHADPDGHDVTFSDLKLFSQFSRIVSESPSLESEYLLAVMDKKMDVRVMERGLRRNEQNSQGDTTVSTTDANGLTTVVIYVDGNGRTSDDTIVHEWGHEKDAREMGGTAFVRLATKQQSQQYEKGQHDERGVEKSAEGFKDNVNRERKQNQKRINEQRKAEAKAEKEKKRKRPNEPNEENQ